MQRAGNRVVLHAYPVSVQLIQHIPVYMYIHVYRITRHMVVYLLTNPSDLHRKRYVEQN